MRAVREGRGDERRLYEVACEKGEVSRGEERNEETRGASHHQLFGSNSRKLPFLQHPKSSFLFSS
jgi:hypothetical protein